MTRQVGGTHYLPGQGPSEFAMAAGWDACAFAILKHVSRHNKLGRGGPVDLEKAAHYVELRSETWGPWSYPRRRADRRPKVAGFCTANGLLPRETEILLLLERWVEDYSAMTVTELVAKITALRDLVYPGRPPI